MVTIAAGCRKGLVGTQWAIAFFAQTSSPQFFGALFLVLWVVFSLDRCSLLETTDYSSVSNQWVQLE